MFNELVKNFKDEIINSTCELIRIPSVYSNGNCSNMPFGENCAKALEYILNLGKSLGFKTKNVNGYCGYIEFGEGNEMLGIIGHLDVVPEGENWTFSPFSATIHNNNIYGRGAIDDKGPIIASLYAMKIIKDKYQINKRVRLIIGLNEENDWKCIEYYKAHEEHPTFGFSPDADFPCIYAEKALLNVHLKSIYTPNANLYIKNIDFENNPMNVVPKFCTVTISTLNIHECYSLLEKIIMQYQFNIELIKDNNFDISIKSYGKAAHAAHPDLGINAISQTIIVLDELFKKYNINISLFSFFNKYINTQYNGENLEINFEDDSGALTLNVARLYIADNKLCISANLRIPVHTPISSVKYIFDNICKKFETKVTYDGEKKALYMSKNNKLVTTLCTVFNNVTNNKYSPIAIGGATYARAFPNFVSFGANMPGQKDMCHQINEFINIDNLLLSTQIYATAIYELTK